MVVQTDREKFRSCYCCTLVPGSCIFRPCFTHSFYAALLSHFERAIPWGAPLYGQIIYKYELLIAEVAVTKGPLKCCVFTARLP